MVLRQVRFPASSRGSNSSNKKNYSWKAITGRICRRTLRTTGRKCNTCWYFHSPAEEITIVSGVCDSAFMSVVQNNWFTIISHVYLLSWDTSLHVLASFSSESESAAVHRSLKISVKTRQVQVRFCCRHNKALYCEKGAGGNKHGDTMGKLWRSNSEGCTAWTAAPI